jgi:hypothetical protein
MKLNVLVLALAATALAAFSANAETVIEQPGAPPVVVEPQQPTVVIKKPIGVEHGSTTIDTTGQSECTTETVQKETFEGTKTTRTTRCK